MSKTQARAPRPCLNQCGNYIGPERRSDVKFCSDRCRAEHHRKATAEQLSAVTAPLAGLGTETEAFLAAAGPLTDLLTQLRDKVKIVQDAMRTEVERAREAEAEALAAARDADDERAGALARANDADARAEAARQEAVEAKEAARRTRAAAEQEVKTANELRVAAEKLQAAAHSAQQAAEESNDNLTLRLREADKAGREQAERFARERGELERQLAAVRGELAQTQHSAAAAREALITSQAEARAATGRAEAAERDLQAALQRTSEREARLEELRNEAAEERIALAAAQATIARLERDLDRAAADARRQAERAAVAEAATGIPLPPGLTVPDIDDVDGTPGIPTGDAGAVLIEHGHVVPVRLPDERPLTPERAARLGLALLTAAAAASNTTS